MIGPFFHEYILKDIGAWKSLLEQGIAKILTSSLTSAPSTPLLTSSPCFPAFPPFLHAVPITLFPAIFPGHAVVGIKLCFHFIISREHSVKHPILCKKKSTI